MTRQLVAEWIKLRTLRGSVALLAIVVGGVVVILALVAALASDDAGTIVVDVSSSLGVLASVSLGALAASNIAGEHNHNTIRTTYTVTPRRGRVLSAKLTLMAVVALVVAAAAFVVAPLAAHHGLRRLVIDDPGSLDGTATQFYGPVVICVLVTVFGFALGMITRTTTLASFLLVLTPLIVEPLVSVLFSLADIDVDRWLPFTALIGSFLSNDDAPWSAIGGSAYFAAWCLALCTIGMMRQLRRDV